jgi:hypothetical protein
MGSQRRKWDEQGSGEDGDRTSHREESIESQMAAEDTTTFCGDTTMLI